jgi:hypothetical protein
MPLGNYLFSSTSSIIDCLLVWSRWSTVPAGCGRLLPVNHRLLLLLLLPAHCLLLLLPAHCQRLLLLPLLGSLTSAVPHIPVPPPPQGDPLPQQHDSRAAPPACDRCSACKDTDKGKEGLKKAASVTMTWGSE